MPRSFIAPKGRAPLDWVNATARAKREAEQHYRDAVNTARKAGHTFTEIADAAGITRQAARKIGRSTQ